jgi:hypothetical protein
MVISGHVVIGVHISIPNELIRPVAPGNKYDRLGVIPIRREWSYAVMWSYGGMNFLSLDIRRSPGHKFLSRNLTGALVRSV